MLTDIFAERYSCQELWDAYTEAESKLLVQSFRIVAEQLIPYRIDGKESAEAKRHWQSLHDKLSMELGLEELSPRSYAYNTTLMGKPHVQSGFWPYDDVCKKFVCGEFTGAVSADRFMKERVSFIELGFRLREDQMKAVNLELPAKTTRAKMDDHRRESKARQSGLVVGGNIASRVDTLIASNRSLNDSFKASVDELNERFRRAKAPLNYHNGFVQVAADPLVEEQIEKPFWQLVAGPLWKNVDADMKEALDLRDADLGDPAFHAAKALESTIKIISDEKGWTCGNEKGAHNYIDNLSSKKSGAFIRDWERDALKSFFTEVRNPFGHGPGSAELPQLTTEQTSWAIETCMSWIKNLVQRV